MNETEFINELKNIDIILTQNQINKFKIYYEYLIEYNKHTNLTSITTKEAVYLKHFYDSCLLTKTIDFNNIDTMLDIGCGAGFPGIVIKILFPNIKLTLSVWLCSFNLNFDTSTPYGTIFILFSSAP